MDQLSLAEGLLKLRHSKIHDVVIQTPDGAVTLAEFRRLKTPYPFITMLPQVDFLEFIGAKARAYPNFRLLMGRRVDELIEEDGEIRGVRYRSDGGRHEVRAALTVGADGRGSLVRHLAGFRSVKTSPPMDVLWFRLPRYPADAATGSVTFRVQTGGLLIVFDRSDCWQVAYLFAKGSYRRLREAGLEALRTSVAELAPEFADRVEVLDDWKQVAVLSVESGFVKRWYRPGLLLIGGRRPHHVTGGRSRYQSRHPGRRRRRQCPRGAAGGRSRSPFGPGGRAAPPGVADSRDSSLPIRGAKTAGCGGARFHASLPIALASALAAASPDSKRLAGSADRLRPAAPSSKVTGAADSFERIRRQP